MVEYSIVYGEKSVRFRCPQPSLEEEDMLKIDMNAMATRVSMGERGRTEVNIAQIKEVMRVFLEELSRYSDEEILEVVKRYKDGAL